MNFLVLLKTHQKLGYFPNLADVPVNVVNHIRAGLSLPVEENEAMAQTRAYSSRTLYRHHAVIRRYLKVKPYDKAARRLLLRLLFEQARTLDNPADLINRAVEELVKESYELPAFSQLDALVRRVRFFVNNRFFNSVEAKLSRYDRERLDGLLRLDPVVAQAQTWARTPFTALKDPPKSATPKHMEELQTKLASLSAWENLERTLDDLPTAKLKQWAEEARVLDAVSVLEMLPPKRHTCLVAFLHEQRVRTIDALIEMFLKRIAQIHTKGKEELERVRERQRSTNERLLDILTQVLVTTNQHQEAARAEGQPLDLAALGEGVHTLIRQRGGCLTLLEECESLAAFNGNNYLPLLWRFYRSHRPLLFRLVGSLRLGSTTQDQSLLGALALVVENANRRVDYLPDTPLLDLSFASEGWQRLIRVQVEGQPRLNRRHLEVAVFSSLATELKTGDLYVTGSEEYADYRTQLLTWEECQTRLEEYCTRVGLPRAATSFVEQLKAELTNKSRQVDESFEANVEFTINAKGEPTLKKSESFPPSKRLQELERKLTERMPPRSVLEILANVHHYTDWTRHFGPLSGADPKLDHPAERYILTTFGYGSNMGPVQLARHLRGRVSENQLGVINRRHISVVKLDAATRDVINSYRRFRLPRLWGTGKTAAADGTQYDLYEENMLAEQHIRYGGYGAIAYHHVSDMYIALFSTFIECGVWEAVYLLDGLLKNTSDVQPDTIHADTQGQNLPVFALTHLLGVKLMPRIRNWKGLIFFRPDSTVTYTHIDSLFGEAIDWALIETHWPDLMQVVLSVVAGKILPSTLLRKLSTYSRKNRLYWAFRELGRVIRTIFLLNFISDSQLRRQVTAGTNKAEAYNGFSSWLHFGGGGERVIAENDPDEQEKRIKYKQLLTNTSIFQNVADMSAVLRQLEREGHEVKPEDMARLSPYLTKHIRRFGDYVLDMTSIPPSLDEELEPEEASKQLRAINKEGRAG